MEGEKLLPLGETAPQATLPSVVPAPMMRIHRRPAVEPIMQPATPPSVTPPVLPGVPTPSQQQWGVLISIVIIVLMIIVGAFYAWGQRIAQNQLPAEITQ